MQKLNTSKISYLSGGELRYLEIKLLLHTDCKFILLDEPFNGLDPESCIVIKNLLKDYCYCKHNMILFSVHNLDLVSNFSDTIILINKDRQLLSLKNTQNISELEDYFFKHCVI